MIPDMTTSKFEVANSHSTLMNERGGNRTQSFKQKRLTKCKPRVELNDAPRYLEHYSP